MTRLARRICSVHRSSAQQTCFRYGTAALLFALTALSACSMFTPSLPGQVDTGDRYERRVYAGIAGASTRLQPVTEDSAYNLDESVSTGAAITLGLDVSPRLALELTAADLGAASLAPIATAGPGVAPQQLNYSTVAGSLLFYAIGDRVRAAQRNGLAAYARLGLNQTGSSADIQIDEEAAMQLYVGLGAEYMLGRSTGLRAEFVGYDGDASAAQLGVLYRFGRSKSRMSGPLVIAPVEQTDAPALEPTSEPTPEPMVAANQESTMEPIIEAEPEPILDQTAQTTFPDEYAPVTAVPEVAGLGEPATEEKGNGVTDTPLPREQPIAEKPAFADTSNLAANTPAEDLLEPTANVDAVVTRNQAEPITSADSTGSANDQQIAMISPPTVNTPIADETSAVKEVPNKTVENETVGDVPIETPIPTPAPILAQPTIEGVLHGVEFTGGTASLSQSGMIALQRYAVLLTQTPGTRVEIQTHTDNTLDAATAMNLSRLRAVSIARALIGAGVNKQQLAARAFGSNVPRADNQTPEGRKLNNRVEIKRL